MNQCVTGHGKDTALVRHRVMVMMSNSGRIIAQASVKDETQIEGIVSIFRCAMRGVDFVGCFMVNKEGWMNGRCSEKLNDVSQRSGPVTSMGTRYKYMQPLCITY